MIAHCDAAFRAFERVHAPAQLSPSLPATRRGYGADGLQVGARAAYDQGPWVASVIGKLALGTMQQSVSVNGFLETNDYNDYGPTQIFPGGYFALRSNIGDHSHNAFAVVPEGVARSVKTRQPQLGHYPILECTASTCRTSAARDATKRLSGVSIS
jgi:Putative beta barrel porin-7 (BBP7)